MNMNDMTLRRSTEEDIPQLKALWVLAFGDSGSYVENFFSTYHQPQRMFVAEKSGQILAMTAYFDSHLQQDETPRPFAYLYAVATHPDFEKQGLASRLLAKIYEIFQAEGYAGVTTVPATPSLHKFFGKNRFQDYFVEYRKTFSQITPDTKGKLTALSAEEYAQARGKFLEKTELSWVDYALDGLVYQKSLGELFHFELGQQSCLFALEQGSEDFFIWKECLGDMNLLPDCLSHVKGIYPLHTVEVRHPLPLDDWKKENFGMIFRFSPEHSTEKTAPLVQEGYLGFAFD